MIMMNKDYH